MALARRFTWSASRKSICGSGWRGAAHRFDGVGPGGTATRSRDRLVINNPQRRFNTNTVQPAIQSIPITAAPWWLCGARANRLIGRSQPVNSLEKLSVFGPADHLGLQIGARGPIESSGPRSETMLSHLRSAGIPHHVAGDSVEPEQTCITVGCLVHSPPGLEEYV